MPTEYVLICDDDGHWYVCPADRLAEASAYFAAAAAYWQPGSEHAGDPPAEPDWLEAVGGSPSRVRFTGYRIGG